MSITKPRAAQTRRPTRPARPAGRRSGRTRRKDNATAYLMLAPMVGLLGVFVFWPLVYSVYLSLFEINFYKGSTFVGMKFYKYVLADPQFWSSVGKGLYFAALVVPSGLVVALLLASFIKTLGRRSAAFVKTVVYLPAVISVVIASLLFRFMYQDEGVVNWLLGLFGVEPVGWLENADTALPAIAVPGLWLSFGLTTLILLAALLDIPESYYESAQLDGAGFFRCTWSITLPLLKNILLYLTVTGLVVPATGIQQLELPLIMTEGGPVGSTTTPNLFIFFSFRDATPYATSYSLTAALLLFVVLGAISLLIFRFLKSEKSIDG
ncbi:carbohydrate ABC transporter permease [Streptomyces sp. NPDC050418]|uniref:carbohydrate ABC transporter permease n=1 Tax=Streptomyces sp. NPDC050418 TaxID=3365612 RepID=UPI0037A237B3